MNKIMLIGNLMHDPEMRATPSGVAVCTFTIAVDRKFRDAKGEKKTDFFRIIAWRQLGESCGRYLAKGRKVAVIGELQARTYDAKDGTVRISLDVSADEVEFLSPKQQEAAAPEPQKTPMDYLGEFSDIHPDDIPF